LRAVLRKHRMGVSTPASRPALTVLLLPGVVTARRRLAGWAGTLRAALPYAEVWVPARCFYWPWGAAGQERMLSAVVAKLRGTSGPVWLLAHSFGGLIARAALARCAATNVVLLTTMASPHAYPALGIAGRARALGVPATCRVPVRTYGGYRDLTVPCRWTPLVGAVHRNFDCGHLAFLFDAQVRAAVLRDALPALTSPQPPVTTS
jgi:pimeloyl-ACP methyl ester carboxylesterase